MGNVRPRSLLVLATMLVSLLAPLVGLKPAPVVATAETAAYALERPAGQSVDLPDVDAHYFLDITELDLGSGRVVVHQRIEVRSRQGPLGRLLFTVAAAEWGYFTLDSAWVNGSQVTPTALNDGYTLSLPLPGGESWTIEFHFRLDIAQVFGGWQSTGRDGEVLRLGHWFPVISDDHAFPETADPAYTRVARFDVWLPLPAGTLFAATGQEAGLESLPDGRVRYHLQADRVRDFAIAISPSYQFQSRTTSSGVHVQLYSRPSIDPALRADILDAAVSAVERLSGLIGPYPYSTFRIADSGPGFASGLEFPVITFINFTKANLLRTVVHETAHQWLYAVVGTRPQQDPWIDEGGAQFLEDGLFSNFTTKRMSPAGGYGQPLDASESELPGGEGIPGYNAIYLQGQAFYQTVLETMGWEPFWTAMQDLYRRYQFQIVTPWDALLTWQQHSSVDLRPLFRETFRYGWIDQLPTPAEARYFPETGQWVSYGFLRYWQRFGDLAVFGYPLTAEYVSNGIVTQVFERARFEWHPGMWPERYDVLLGLLGRELTQGRQQEPPFRPVQATSDANCTFYPETGHRLCFGFRAYWERNGGVAIFGYPISEEFVEGGLVVQYFERQRFEYHPANPPEWRVLGGRLGAQQLERARPASYGSGFATNLGC